MKKMYDVLVDYVLNCERMDDEMLDTLYRFALGNGRHPLHPLVSLYDEYEKDGRASAGLTGFIEAWRDIEKDYEDVLND